MMKKSFTTLFAAAAILVTAGMPDQRAQAQQLVLEQRQRLWNLDQHQLGWARWFGQAVQQRHRIGVLAVPARHHVLELVRQRDRAAGARAEVPVHLLRDEGSSLGAAFRAAGDHDVDLGVGADLDAVRRVTAE